MLISVIAADLPILSHFAFRKKLTSRIRDWSDSIADQHKIIFLFLPAYGRSNKLLVNVVNVAPSELIL